MTSSKEYKPGTCCVASIKILEESCKAVAGSNVSKWPKSRFAKSLFLSLLVLQGCPRHCYTSQWYSKLKSCSAYTYIATNLEYSRIGEQGNSIHALRRSINSVTMSMCDVLLRHCNTLLLYMWGYTLHTLTSYIYTLGLTYTYTAQVSMDTTIPI